LLFEHGWQQGEAIQGILHGVGYHSVKQYYDASMSGQVGHERMLVASRA
jgi:methylase of polypeptide subunit release factors